MENIVQWLQLHVTLQTLIAVGVVALGVWLLFSTLALLLRLALCLALIVGGGYWLWQHFAGSSGDAAAQVQRENEKQEVMDTLRGVKRAVVQKTEKAKEYIETVQEANKQRQQLETLKNTKNLEQLQKTHVR